MIAKTLAEAVMLRTNQVHEARSGMTHCIRYPDTSATGSAVEVIVRLGDLQILRRLARQVPFDDLGPEHDAHGTVRGAREAGA